VGLVVYKDRVEGRPIESKWFNLVKPDLAAFDGYRDERGNSRVEVPAEVRREVEIESRLYFAEMYKGLVQGVVPVCHWYNDGKSKLGCFDSDHADEAAVFFFEQGILPAQNVVTRQTLSRRAASIIAQHLAGSLPTPERPWP
jgi:hypothetical protein